MYIVMVGNLDSGFKAVGPFETFDDAAEWDKEGSWVMSVEAPKPRPRGYDPVGGGGGHGRSDLPYGMGGGGD